jgi:hypothetical protein
MTNEVSKLLMGIHHLADDVWTNGHNIVDMAEASSLYNDNESCIKWSHNMTTKQIRHMEMRENAVHEWVQDAFLKVLHVSGRINPADIFTKEMRDGAIFDAYEIFSCVLCLIFFSSLCWMFISCVSIMRPCLYRSFHQPFLQQLLSPGVPISWLFLSPLSGTLTAISHLSSAGCHIFRSLHWVVPSVLI